MIHKIFSYTFLFYFISFNYLDAQTNYDVTGDGVDSLRTISDCLCTNKTILDSTNFELDSLVDTIVKPGFIRLDLEDVLNGTDLNDIAHLLGVSPLDSFVIDTIIYDTIDYDNYHIKYKQYHDGVLVENGVLINHFIDCINYLVNGYVMECIEITSDPEVPLSTIIDSVEAISELVSITPEQEANGKLVYDQDLIQSCEYKLAWKIDYFLGEEIRRVFANAKTGEIYKDVTLDGHGIAPTENYGNQNINDTNTGSNLILKSSSGVDFKTKPFTGLNMFSHAPCVGQFSACNFAIESPNSITDWLDPNFVAPSGMIQSHWVVQKAIEFYNTIGHAGPRGNKTVIIKSHCSNDNSLSRNADIFFGTGWNTLKWAGHETFHTFNRENDYSFNGFEGESVEEAMCDFIGIYVSYLHFNSTNLKMETATSLIRNLKNPEIPHMNEIQNANNSHEASGIMSRAYSLLITGGVNIGSLGVDKTFEIFIKAWQNYISTVQSFLEMREATVSAAIDIYGECSYEVDQVKNAWAAVGVGSTAEDCFDLSHASSSHYCFEDLDGCCPINICASFYPGNTFIWNYPSNWIDSNPYNQCISVREKELGAPWQVGVYPVSATAPNGRKKVVLVYIQDCLGGDSADPCEEYEIASSITNNDPDNNYTQIKNNELITQYKSYPNVKNTSIKSEEILNSLDNKFSLYSMDGNLLQSGVLGDLQKTLPLNGIFVLIVFDNQNTPIHIEKRAFFN